MLNNLFIPLQKTMLMLLVIGLSFYNTAEIYAQHNPSALYKVLTLPMQQPASVGIARDHGLDGLWQKLLKLQTTASVLEIQAHPDDEQADLLTWLARGHGARTALLSLNRGEGGSNILGSESFDQLGMLRTEEFLLAAAYYGLDDLYFTNLVDYGFSKRVGEAYEKWGRQNILAEMVRVIRINRPLVIISRFHGSERDGHGNHQAAGEISPDAFTLAADPDAFPEQISKEGLRPWKTLKFYRGGVTAEEHWNIRLNTGDYCPWLGDSYKNFGSLGYSFHRSQFGGQFNRVSGDINLYYERLAENVKAGEKENNFFEGIDTSISGIFNLTQESHSPETVTLLRTIDNAVHAAITVFNPAHQNAILPFLTDGLGATRKAILQLNDQPGARFLLQVKEQQFMDAINEALGMDLQAIAIPATAKEPAAYYEPPVTMGFAVPSQPFKIALGFSNRNSKDLTDISITLTGPNPNQLIGPQLKISGLRKNEKVDSVISLIIPAGTTFSKPYYHRSSLQDNRYQYDNNEAANLPGTGAAIQVVANYKINKEWVKIQKPVETKQADLPYGFTSYKLKIAPALAVNIEPSTGIILKNEPGKMIDLQVQLLNNQEGAGAGQLQLSLPPGWKSTPVMVPFSFTNAGEKNSYSFKIAVPAVAEELYEVKAIAVMNGHSYSQGYELSSHHDLDQTLLYRDAISRWKAIDMKIPPCLQVGYVMGAGDEVPAAIRQLGAVVELLKTEDLATGTLNGFDVIMIGTRAYAVRKDLNEYNQRLLDYVKNGGHLVVLFQTPEFIPGQSAPFPASLPDNPEEISEEDAPVTILDSSHRVFNFPNKISISDFDNWVEQRGSKFFSDWDSAYTPMISTHDKGQAPQQGGWLMAKSGKGYYTYFAYSLHRQLPNGVNGAYKILANLLSYGKK